jgi:post-segregation antitoxin (ccd killing protein)
LPQLAPIILVQNAREIRDERSTRWREETVARASLNRAIFPEGSAEKNPAIIVMAI